MDLNKVAEKKESTKQFAECKGLQTLCIKRLKGVQHGGEVYKPSTDGSKIVRRQPGLRSKTLLWGKEEPEKVFANTLNDMAT
jgi:hypothetical protein